MAKSKRNAFFRFNYILLTYKQNNNENILMIMVITMICTSTVHTKKNHECTNKDVIHAGFAFFKFELLKSSMS